VGVWIGEVAGKGRGIFAARRFTPGETVISSRAIAEVDGPTRMSVALGWDRHVEMDEPATLLNHDCEPNLGVRENALSAYDFVALREISAGEELTFDYAMTEYELATPLSCRCGGVQCAGTIRPWRERDQAWRELAAPHCAGYLRAALAECEPLPAKVPPSPVAR
jgi:uncharacterized protein